MTPAELLIVAMAWVLDNPQKDIFLGSPLAWAECRSVRRHTQDPRGAADPDWIGSYRVVIDDKIVATCDMGGDR